MEAAQVWTFAPGHKVSFWQSQGSGSASHTLRSESSLCHKPFLETFSTKIVKWHLLSSSFFFFLAFSSQSPLLVPFPNVPKALLLFLGFSLMISLTCQPLDHTSKLPSPVLILSWPEFPYCWLHVGQLHLEFPLLTPIPWPSAMLL